MPVLLPAKFRHLASPAALGETSSEIVQEQYLNLTFPAPTGI